MKPADRDVPASSPVAAIPTGLCAGLDGLADDKVAAMLSIDAKMLTRLRETGNTDNESICKMSFAERNDLMVAYRRKLLRAPGGKVLRPASKEYIRLWDADDQGNQPGSEQVLAADAARRRLAGLSSGMMTPKGLALPSKPAAAGIGSSTWSALGPGNVGGRIRSILIDPRNANRIFIGSVTGGIWLTTDAGRTFAPVADMLSNIAIGALAYAPSNPDVMYAGTGESYQGFTGIGLYKSADAGVTWTFLGSTSTSISSDWVLTNRIAVSLTSPNVVIAANNGGLYRSADGGANWTKVLANASTMLDIKFDPNNPLNAVASGLDGFMYYSTDTGMTWQRTTSLMSPDSNNSGRAEIAYAKTVPNLVLISLDNNSGELWASTDGGATWALRSNPKQFNGQGEYDNAIWVDPLNENNVVLGGLDLNRSTDGGVTFVKISTWQNAGPALSQPHADHHIVVSGPNYSAATPIVYCGNDGGLYRSSNILLADANTSTYWENLNNGLAVTQFYGGAGARTAGGMLIGGTQDNGSLYQYQNTNWDRFAGGDGGFVAVDPVSDNTLYGEYVYASIHRTIALGSRQYICTGITEGKKSEGGSTYCGANATEQTNFISPFILDPTNRTRMLVGAASLWVSNNVQALPPAWTPIKPPASSSTTSRHYINAVAVHAGDGNIIWVGYNTSGQIWKTTTGLAASPAWSQVNVSNMPTSTVNRITIDQDNSNHVWVVYSGFASNRLWETTDGGATWHSITSNLPAVTLHDIKRHPGTAQWLYAAAANGVYTSENGGQTWNTTNDGPSSVRVRELFWYDSNTLVAATFGRGMFSARAVLPVPLSRRGGIDIDGQGKSQLILRSPSGFMQAGRLSSGTFSFSAINDPGSTYKVTAAGDLDGNGKSDLVFQTLSTDAQGRVTVDAWIDFSVAGQITLRPVNPAWVIQASADMDGDGYGDLVFRFTGDDGTPNDTGVSYIWFQKAGGAYDVVRKRGGAPLDWQIVGAADLNGDGAADLVYLSPANQLKALMATAGRTCANLSAGTVPTSFTALHMADYTGNRRGDILIRDANGVTKLLSLNGSGLSLPPYTGNPDDINASCTSSGLTVANTTINLPASDPTWTYFASGDFNGDGIFDVVWRQPSGTLTVWLMQANGAAPTVISNAGSVPVGGYVPIPLH